MTCLDVFLGTHKVTGFVLQPVRWVVEQTYGILMFHRRMVRGYETLPTTSEARVYWAIMTI